MRLIPFFILPLLLVPSTFRLLLLEAAAQSTSDSRLVATTVTRKKLPSHPAHLKAAEGGTSGINQGISAAQLGYEAPTTTGTTYFVDNVGGNDSNSGTAPQSAFATIAKINSLTLAPGQTVAFKANGVWHEMLVVSNSGTAVAPITYTSYGDGAQPLIDASDNVMGWTQGTGSMAQQSCTGSCLFASGFEVANFADWTSTNVSNPANDSLTISPGNPNSGSSSMLLTSTNGSDCRIWTAKSFAAVAANGVIGVRFYIKTPVGAYKPYHNEIVFNMNANGAEKMNAAFATDGNGNPTSISVYNEANGVEMIPQSTWLTNYSVGAWNEVEVDLNTSATAGGATVYLNGMQIGSFNNVNGSGLVGVSQILLGNLSYGSLSSSGSSLQFDDFEISNGSLPIGLLSAGLSTNIWSRKQTTSPGQINFAGQVGTPVSGIPALTGPNQFYWDGSSTLYTASLIDPTSTVEVPARISALTSSGASYIAVSGLELRGGTNTVSCGVSSPCSYWDFEGNTFDSASSVLLRWEFNNGIQSAGLTVNGNIFRGAGSAGIGIGNGGSSMGVVITNNTFYDLCRIYTPGSNENSYCDAMNLFSQTGTDGGGYVGYNFIHDVGLTSGGPYGGGVHPDTVLSWDIEHNVIMNTNYPGIELEKGSGSKARYNLLINTGQYQYFAGLLIRGGDGLSVSNQLAEYNTVIGGWAACTLGLTQNSGTVTATNITLRKNICGGSATGTQLWIDPGYGGSSNTISNNNFGPAVTNFATIAGTYYATYASLPSLVGGSLPGTPLFSNSAQNDYSLQSASPVLGIGAFPTYKPGLYTETTPRMP